jgi:hypothetical protein
MLTYHLFPVPYGVFTPYPYLFTSSWAGYQVGVGYAAKVGEDNGWSNCRVLVCAGFDQRSPHIISERANTRLQTIKVHLPTQ